MSLRFTLNSQCTTCAQATSDAFPERVRNFNQDLSYRTRAHQFPSITREGETTYVLDETFTPQQLTQWQRLLAEYGLCTLDECYASLRPSQADLLKMALAALVANRGSMEDDYRAYLDEAPETRHLYWSYRAISSFTRIAALVYEQAFPSETNPYRGAQGLYDLSSDDEDHSTYVSDSEPNLEPTPSKRKTNDTPLVDEFEAQVPAKKRKTGEERVEC